MRGRHHLSESCATPHPPLRGTFSPKGRRGALHLLILGGTTEASALARAVAGRSGIAPLLSLAGRTENPTALPIPHRVGGYGGAAGLASFLREEAIGAVVDATHPFAVRISANAVAACRAVGAPLAVFTRPPWQPEPGDRWTAVPDLAAAADALRDTHLLSSSGIPSRIFLTTGRLDLARFKAAPDPHYLVRTIDPPAADDLPPNATVVLARPPFAVEDEIALMQLHGIDLLVTKNSGGAAGRAKLVAARRLGLPVLMIDRPAPAGAVEYHGLDAILGWIADQRAV